MSIEKVTIQLTGLSLKIRSAISAETEGNRPEVASIVAGLEADLDNDEVADALRRGLKLLVEREARTLKREAMHRAHEDAARVGHALKTEKRRTKAAEQLAEVTDSHTQLVAERFFAIWKETPTGRKFLGECTAEDLRYSHQRNIERSEHLSSAAASDARLAEAIEGSGAETVRGLGYDLAARAIAGDDDASSLRHAA